MEIKPQELRIGNLLHREDGTGVLVDALAIVEASQRQIANGNTGLKGIDLTPEWLEKFGFRKEKTGFAGGQDQWAGMPAWSINNEWLFRGTADQLHLVGFFNTQVTKVHQLQNLYFALTGKELAIDNKSL